MRYIAVFDIPDGYVMGCASAKICPNDGKSRTDKEFDTVYADIEPLMEQGDELYERYKGFDRIISDLGISCAYDMPSFWCDKGENYKVIPTKYHKGYMQAIEDVEKEVRKRFGFAEKFDVNMAPPFE